MRPKPQAIVRSTLPEAKAVMSAPVQAPVHRAVRSEVRARSAGARARAETLARPVVHGEAGTGDARSCGISDCSGLCSREFPELFRTRIGGKSE